MEKQFKLRNLGPSELMISPIGLGCWQFSKRGNLGGKFWPFLEDEVIREIVKISIDGGINWFDTAEIYGAGASEKSLARSLDELGVSPGEVTIATKWWPMFRTAANIGKSIHERMQCLAPFPIDLYQVHQPYSFSSEVKEMESMADLVKRKKIKHVGVSNFSARKMRNAWETLNKSGIRLLSNQVRYSLLNRQIERNGVLETAQELGITIIAYSPLAQGLLTGKFHDDPGLLKNIGYRKYLSGFKTKGLEKSRPLIALIQQLALKYHVTPSQVALNWLIHFNGDAVVAIPGATKVEQAAENTGALKFTLSREDMEALDRISREF